MSKSKVELSLGAWNDLLFHLLVKVSDSCPKYQSEGLQSPRSPLTPYVKNCGVIEQPCHREITFLDNQVIFLDTVFVAS